MTRSPLDRAAVALGVCALAGGLFGWLTRESPPIDFALVRGATLAVLASLGVVAVLGGVLRRRALVLLAGAGLALAALLQLLQLGGSTNWLDGNGSTLSLMGGFGLGLLAVGLPPHDPTTVPEGMADHGP